jgi:hypothetical protein
MAHPAAAIMANHNDEEGAKKSFWRRIDMDEHGYGKARTFAYFLKIFWSNFREGRI